ncbi:MAG: hypothetical protein K0U37_04880 [Gammaproteobacteria bacterium]|nr:hypothetical protein [Gammaproteobacteria bacterium]
MTKLNSKEISYLEEAIGNVLQPTLVSLSHLSSTGKKIQQIQAEIKKLNEQLPADLAEEESGHSSRASLHRRPPRSRRLFTSSAATMSSPLPDRTLSPEYISIHEKIQLLQIKITALTQNMGQWNTNVFDSALSNAFANQPTQRFGFNLSHHERINAAKTTALNHIEGRVDPLFLFDKRVEASLKYFLYSEKQDIKQFEQEYKQHVNELARGFRQYGQSTIVDYVLALGKALLGALLSILTAPILALSSEYRRTMKNTFFAGPETDKSREVQAKLGGKFADELLPKAREESINLSMASF